MSYQSGCHGRVVLGELPADVQERLAELPGEWLEYDPETGTVEISHVQPSTGPILATVTVELVRILGEIPHEHQTSITGGYFFVHTEEPATQLVRLHVEPGGSLHVQWAHPDYAGAARRPYAGDHEVVTPPWEHCLNGQVRFETDDPAAAAERLRRLADTYEGLYPEGDFRAEADEDGHGVVVAMQDVNLDGKVLVQELQALARPRTLHGRLDLGSFADFVPENLVRFVFEKGKVWVQHPLLWS